MIAIIDYGLGNIKAFANVYKRLNIPFRIASELADLDGASKIILPGVGAFDHAISMLMKSGLKDKLDELVLDRKIPVLGICVGMQILANSSEEGVMDGLGWVAGHVKRLFSPDADSSRFPLPHMGWNSIEIVKDDRLFHAMEENPRFYFLHSYYFECENEQDSIACADYGKRFTCIVKREHIYGVQCHPEKSHHNGVALLKNFAGL